MLVNAASHETWTCMDVDVARREKGGNPNNPLRAITYNPKLIM